MKKIRQTLLYPIRNPAKSMNFYGTKLKRILKYDDFDNKIIDIVDICCGDVMIPIQRQITMTKFDKKNNPTNQIYFNDNNITEISEPLSKDRTFHYDGIMENKYNENGQLIGVKKIRYLNIERTLNDTSITKYEYHKVFLDKVIKKTSETINHKEKKYRSISEAKYDSDGRKIESTYGNRLNPSERYFSTLKKYSYYFDDEGNQIKETLTFNAKNGELENKEITSKYNQKSYNYGEYSFGDKSPHMEVDYIYEDGLKKFQISTNHWENIRYKYEDTTKVEYLYDEHPCFSESEPILSLENSIKELGIGWDIN